MAQISHVDSDFSGRRELEMPVSPGESQDDGRKQSLLSKVKDKAKGTVRKIRKIGKKDGSGQTGESSEESEEEEEEGSASQSTESLEATAQTDISDDGANGSLRPPSFKSYQGILKENLLSSFARSDESENSPLVAVPTSYSDGRSSFGEFMPSDIIEPTSVSDIGEENSTSLGQIPEVKDQEQAALSEDLEGEPDSGAGSPSTFNQKDLQAIDGLPKPKGFDIDNQSSVKSYFSVVTSDSEDETMEREVGNDAQNLDGLQNLDSKSPHPPASDAEFQDSMFRSKDSSDIIPDVPPVEEAKYANVIGTSQREPEQKVDEVCTKGDREFSSESLQSLDSKTPHPPAAVVEEFQDSIFHSKASSDIRLNEPPAGEAKYANVIGTLSRGPEPKEDRELSSEALENLDSKTPHPPASTVAEFDDSMFHSKASSDIHPNEPTAEEAKYANVIGTLPRQPEHNTEEVNVTPDRELSFQDLRKSPARSEAELFQGGTSSSEASNDVKPNDPAVAEAQQSNFISTISRDAGSHKPRSDGRGELPSSGGAEDAKFHDAEWEASPSPLSAVVPQPNDSDGEEVDTFLDASSDANILLGQKSLDPDNGDELPSRH